MQFDFPVLKSIGNKVLGDDSGGFEFFVEGFRGNGRFMNAAKIFVKGCGVFFHVGNIKVPGHRGAVIDRGIIFEAAQR